MRIVNAELWFVLGTLETMVMKVELGVCQLLDSFLAHPYIHGLRWVLQEVNVALAKPEGLLPYFIETHRGVKPEKI